MLVNPLDTVSVLCVYVAISIPPVSVLKTRMGEFVVRRPLNCVEHKLPSGGVDERRREMLSRPRGCVEADIGQSEFGLVGGVGNLSGDGNRRHSKRVL